ncbi:MAG: hypothetical protein CM15mP29_3730 [Alphaproteobacteria bacterium]|nr:MAG: hypothetical protein CM15mP29_3730 [Alphaproteobacteria bacterium]
MQIKKNLIDFLVEASQSINEALIKINENKEK